MKTQVMLGQHSEPQATCQHPVQELPDIPHVHGRLTSEVNVTLLVFNVEIAAAVLESAGQHRHHILVVIEHSSEEMTELLLGHSVYDLLALNQQLEGPYIKLLYAKKNRIDGNDERQSSKSSYSMRNAHR